MTNKEGLFLEQQVGFYNKTTSQNGLVGRSLSSYCLEVQDMANLSYLR